MSGGFDPLVPREIDRWSVLPLDADLSDGEAAVALEDAKILAGPDDPADRPRWREQLRTWRDGVLARHPDLGARYDRPETAWSSRCFAVAQVWLWDELFFDSAAQRFTPERLLADARERLGGLDGLVLWHAYPVIGIDDRNQWDFYDVPGLAEAAAALQAAGVAVFVDYNPWDTGTRRAAGTDAEELAATIRRLGADGVFLDTLRKADPELVATLEAARPGIALEGESKLATERIADHATSWAQWFADSPVPGVLRAHWLERRHLQHHVRRWNRDHAEELTSAWLNGVGVMVWEVVFGVWVGWNPRDASTLRRMLPVQRALADVLHRGDWTPLTDLGPEAPGQGIFGSLYETDDLRLWTLASRSDVDHVLALPADAPGRWLALHDGVELELADGETGTLEVTVPARSIAAAVHVPPGVAPPDLASLQAELAAIRATTPDHDGDASFGHRRAVRTAGAPSRGGAPADATVVVVPPGEHVLTVRFRQRETGMYDGAPYVDEWKPLPPRLHDSRTLERVATLAHPVAVAAREVSEAEFDAFVDATGYVPAVAHRFRTERRGPDAPVTGVNLADTRAYAAWCGARLPTEDEWQLAASLQGFERRAPAVWSWTESEHTDGRTRFVMLKGGSDHVSEGSDWYTDGGVRPPEFTLKFLVPGLGIERSPSIGFRICWDTEGAS
ncbi:hypothetical protein C8046_09420 [Serinibacter arcticus]|uniref:Sulfatase-modifying factor enzyme-like domain-containing protein n=1 Tax=Serinibacter arcticus TaxID=1655435 RepID=A0A2U1ZV17_9MICO|nr:SUMF1/EgtB/PvdO family nonheme iron enzyme [Serinibacter arcticus]PWD50835.1 hypothetical protein C8046_09420 [Serinibacter arcticus]